MTVPGLEVLRFGRSGLSVVEDRCSGVEKGFPARRKGEASSLNFNLCAFAPLRDIFRRNLLTSAREPPQQYECTNHRTRPKTSRYGVYWPPKRSRSAVFH